MRPFVLFSTFLSLFFAAASVAADQTEIIGNQDQRIQYTDGWFSFPFRTASGGTLAVTLKNSDTATLTVNNATSIAVTVFVEDPGQTVRISLDNQIHDIAPTLSQPAWTSGFLDPSVPHTIQVIKQNPRKKFTSLDSFLVTYSSPNTTGSISTVPDQSTYSADASDGTTPIPTPSAQTAAPANQQSGAEPVLSGAKLAGVIVACITVSGLIIAGFLYRRRRIRKRKAASTEYWEWMSSRAQAAQGQPPPPFTPSDKFNSAETRETV